MHSYCMSFEFLNAHVFHMLITWCSFVFTDSSDWDKFLHTYMTACSSESQMWVLNQQPSHPVMVVRYEDLKTDTMKEMERC